MIAEISTSTVTRNQAGARHHAATPLPRLHHEDLSPPCWPSSSLRRTVSVRPLSLPPCTSLPPHRRQCRYHRLPHSGRPHHPSLLPPHHHTSGAVASAGAALAGAAPVIYTRRRRATTSSTTAPAAATDTAAAASTSLAPQPAPPAPSPPPPRPPAGGRVRPRRPLGHPE